MSTVNPSNLYPSPISATNFDLPSLHILRNEINVALKNAETHLSEFNDDAEQAPLLLDSVDVMQQLARILDLLSLDGGSDLTRALAGSLQLLYDNGDNSDENIILDISEAIMTLDRYIEFVLLKEILEPPLLIPIINKLHQHLNQPILQPTSFDNRKTGSVSISNPEKNFQSLNQLNLDSKSLSTAYRAGLGVVLSSSSKAVSIENRKKIHAMQKACEIIASRSNTLFWQAAVVAVTDIDQILPLSTLEKRTLIFLEQQFHNYLPISDKRFADLVSFACQRDNDLAQQIKQAYNENKLNDHEQEEMRRFLFGPNREVTETLNEIIQEQISTIKDDVDCLVRAEVEQDNPVTTHEIASKLNILSSTLKLLDLNEASEATSTEAKIVSQWNSPSPQDFDELLVALIAAENASIHMAKIHTPGAVKRLLHNNKISLHQLDTSYERIIIESRSNISKIEQAITEYIYNDSNNDESLNHLPKLLREITGSLAFLKLTDASKMISRLVSHISNDDYVNYSEDKLSDVANVLMAVDYYLRGLENDYPVNESALNIGHISLNKLLAA